jgi:hypothetical protein
MIERTDGQCRRWSNPSYLVCPRRIDIGRGLVRPAFLGEPTPDHGHVIVPPEVQ